MKEITYYSDTCGGQNRNKFVAAGLLHLLAKDGSSLNTINHKFFESGHSQIELDTKRSTIENAKRKTSVYVPSQWNTVISLARKTKPFVVIPMKYTDFKDFKEMTKLICPNIKYTTAREKVNWLKI